MYGVRLLEDLKIDPQQGVVRVSLVHYNTEEEVEAVLANALFDRQLAAGYYSACRGARQRLAAVSGRGAGTAVANSTRR